MDRWSYINMEGVFAKSRVKVASAGNARKKGEELQKIFEVFALCNFSSSEIYTSKGTLDSIGKRAAELVAARLLAL
jgi:hypothetical protein